jgi:DNA-binding response OmpR family regulator
MQSVETGVLSQPEGHVGEAAVARPAGRPRIAVIASDRAFVQVLLNRVDRLGWQALAHETAPSPHDLLGERLSAVVVDPEVLDDDVFGFIEGIGKVAPELALVVVSANSSVRDRVRALHLGADDWIQKPCHPDEVAARIEAILRRARRATSRLMTAPSVSGELEIDMSRFQVYVGENSLDFTRREFEVLRLLAGAVGKVLTREEIYEQVWGYRMAHGDRSVDVFVRKVRQKLEKASPEWTYIHTHFGLGYRFEPSARPA